MKKRALLIGINNYLYFKDKTLAGCVNDTKIMADVLKKRFGFGADDITFLLNEAATRDAIVKELEKILNSCETDDIIVLHFSGHGSRRLSSNKTLTPDGLEETIMPHDAGPAPHLNRDIRDSDLRSWLALITKKTTNISLFFDSCHSGSIVREEEKIRYVQTDLPLRIIRGDPTDSKDGSFPATDTADQESGTLFSASSANSFVLTNNYSLLTACQKNKPAYEHTVEEFGEVNHYGAFTYFLTQELNDAPDDSTYLDIFDKLRIKMQTVDSGQIPQIEGNKTQKLFSNIKIETMPYVLVKQRLPNKIVIEAGHAHGLISGSEWAIYPVGTKRASEENKIGRARITAVEPVISRAEIIEENGSKITAGCRAVEEIHYDKDRRKTVYINNLSNVAKSFEESLAAVIEQSSWLQMSGDNDSDFIISFEQTKAINKFQVKILQAGNQESCWEMTNPADQDLLKIRRNLETLTKYSIVLELENPSSKLKDLIEFDLLKEIDGKWCEAPREYNDLPKYLEDEPIAFRIVNKSSTPIYVSVLDLGLTKKIGLLYPPQAASEVVGSQQAATERKSEMGILQVGLAAHDKIELFIPETAYLSEFSNIGQKGGVEVFKLIVTLEQTDFSWIEQEGLITRQRNRSGFSVEDLLYEYLIERRMRDARIKTTGLSDWCSINCGFYLCKK